MLSKAIEEQGAPSYICNDNSRAFIAHQVQQWLSDKKNQGHLYRSGQSLATERSDPSTRGSENKKRIRRVVSQPLRRCTEERSDDIAKRSRLNREVLLSVAEAQRVIEPWLQTYNH